ncbi:MAG: alanine racemase [Rhodobacteraceae bacterium]|nr:alanine racemase [Paracoccaceae bacterium]
MFLDVLRRRNPEFIEAAISLHQTGKIPSNSYVLDLDAVEENARLFSSEARKLGLSTFAMTKQVGRNSGFCNAVKRGGIDRIVAVDMACALACERGGIKTGHLGHLVQIPRHEADTAARRVRPDFWTVFSADKAREAADASIAVRNTQRLLARIHTEGDVFYRGHEGGFPAENIVAVADMIDSLNGASFAGITTFPALLFDNKTGRVIPTPNLSTLARARDSLLKNGRDHIEVNAPGTTSSVVLGGLADAGATQCEPGNGLHGTTPLHAVEDLPERPAVLYLTEVSHCHNGKAYCFGGGLYIDPVFPDYDVMAIVSSEPTVASSSLASVEIPPPSAIDYYGMIDMSDSTTSRSGDTVVFGFRGQAFVTRALVTGVSGISKGTPQVVSIEDCLARTVDWKAPGK